MFDGLTFGTMEQINKSRGEQLLKDIYDLIEIANISEEERIILRKAFKEDIADIMSLNWKGEICQIKKSVRY